jgi:phage tail tape-measure protein
MAQLVGRVDEMSQVAEIFGALRTGSEAVVRGALKGAEERYVVDMAGWRQVQAEFSDLATEARRAAHSGNPARRAAFEAFDFSANAAKIGGLEVEIGKVAKYSKIIPVAGTVIDLSLAGYDIAHGESESSVLAGLGGGFAGGAVGSAAGAGAAAFFGVSNPVGWVVLGAVGIGIGGSYAGKWLWEATVDLNTRESIDHWIQENVFWDPTTGTLKTG